MAKGSAKKPLVPATLLLCLALGIGLTFALTARHQAQKETQAEAEFEHQLQLARDAGMPTSPAELKATVPPVEVDENAAPDYLNLARLRVQGHDRLQDLARRCVNNPDAPTVAEAKRLLAENAQVLELLAHGADKRHCWFDRDWSQGYAMLLPELAHLKEGTRLTLLRGSIAAHEGRPDEAIAEARKAFQIARHLREEPISVSHLVGRLLESMALQHLAYWSFAHRSSSIYLKELKSDLQSMTPPDLKTERRADLTNLLLLVDWSRTEEGRKKIGFKESDIPPGAKLLPLLQSESEGRIKLVEGVRKRWEALGAPADNMQSLTEEGDELVMSGLFSFPAASGFIESAGEESPVEELKDFRARKMLFEIASRALSAETVPTSNPAPSLVSPLDGKPVRYQFDGTHILINAGKDSPDKEDLTLKIPPNPKAPQGATRSY